MMIFLFNNFQEKIINPLSSNKIQNFFYHFKMILKVLYFFALHFSLVESTIHEIYIAQGASAPYDGSKNYPYSSIYSAFSLTATNYISIATTSDEFHFKIAPSANSSLYFIKDDDISDGELFKNFLGNPYYRTNKIIIKIRSDLY